MGDRDERSKILKEFEKKLIEIDENIKEVSNLKEVLGQLPDKMLKKLEHKPIVKIVEEDEDDSDDEKVMKYNSMKPKIKQKRIWISSCINTRGRIDMIQGPM